MLTVKTAAQLAALRGDAPEPVEPKPDHTEAMARNMEAATTAMQQSTARHEAALLHSLNLIHSVAEKMNTPVDVTVSNPENVRRWKFTCKYDGRDKLTHIIAEAD